MIIKTCKQCGCTMTVTNNRIRLCDTCRKLNREKHAKEYCVKYRKEKKWAVSINKEDNELLEKISSACGLSKAKIIHVLLENFKETY